MALAAPLMVAWVWQHGLASMGDDSFSYLTLAHYYAPGRSWADQWAWQHGHLAPLFPLALLLSGGSGNLLVAHLLVAAFAIAGLGFAYAFAARILPSRVGASLLVAAFLITPTAWISIKGIMSESLYLLFSFAALWFHAARLEGPGRAPREWLAFGLLLACAYLTRSAGIALVLAYGVHAALRVVIRRERPVWPLMLPALPVALLASLWFAVRPGDGSGYRDAIVFTFEHWADRRTDLLPYAWRLFQEGWIASFHADVWTHPLARGVFLALLAVGLAGSALNAWRNRLDGWYVLVALAITFFWMFPQDATRRLMYPLVLLVMLHAAEVVLLLTRRLSRDRRLIALGALAALPLLVCVPAAFLMLQKASDRVPVPGSAYAYSDITDYFLFVNEGIARSMAGLSLSTLAGFDGVAALTPPGAKVMWVRPEYVQLLARREAVAWENDWDSRRLAQEIERSGTGYVIFGETFKPDVKMTMVHPDRVLADLPRYAHAVLTIRNPATRRAEFILYEIDRDKLARYLREGEAAPAR